MRWTLFFPLTFVAGVHGFAIFAPYLFFIAMLVAMKRRNKSASPAAIPAENEIRLPDVESRPLSCSLPKAL